MTANPPSLSESSLRSLRSWGGALFFFSGMTGLIYEILWTRRLNLTFGHSILAVSTVVTAYMGGLALGSALGGRVGDRRLRAGEKASWFLASYGRLEALVGIWAFLSLPLLGLVESLYLKMSSQGLQGFGLYLLAFAASMLVLLPPTTAMGATLPLVSCLYQSDTRGLGTTLSRLYSTNTFGAVTGVALAGFLLLPILGLTWSVTLAGCLNLAIAAISLKVSHGLSGQLEAEEVPSSEQSPKPHRSQWLLPVGFAITGLLSMAAQMAWTRSLSLSLGSSVYAFSIILVVFLCGIAGGSALYERWFGQRQPEWPQLAQLTAGVGLTSLVAIPLLGQLPLLFLQGFPLVRDQYWKVMLLDLALSALVLAAPTLLMGLSFPMVTQLYHRHCGQLGKSVGNIYSANTLGCIVGSFLTGFVLIPKIGVQTTLELATAGNFLVAAVYGFQERNRFARVAASALIPLAGLVFWLPAWDEALLSAGVAAHGSLLRDERSTISRHEPVYYRDGLSGTVSVQVWRPGGLNMRVNGKPEASLGIPDRINQTVLGLLPLFYCREPERVGVIGLGSGLTLTATASCPRVKRADCAELEPYVIEAERYFTPYNEAILRDPRVKAFYADGRTMIMGDPQGFDVLVSVPSNPWVAGVGNLYTQDFYRSARAKLKPGGVLVQWVNLYSLSPSDLQTVVQTFGSVFPESQLWALGGDLALVGGQPLATLETMQDYYQRSSYLRRELAELGFQRPEQLLGAYACPLEFALRGAPKAAINTDDIPCLEYSAPYSMYLVDSYASNLAWVYGLRSQYAKLPPGLTSTPELEKQASLGSLAFSDLHRARKASLPGWEPLVSLFGGNRANDPGRQQRRLAWLAQYPHWAEARIWLAQECRLHHDVAEILEVIPHDLSPTQPSDPNQRYFWYLLRAECHLSQKQWQLAQADYQELAKGREFCDFDSALALCALQQNQLPQASLHVERALALNPYDPRAFFVRGQLWLRQGQEARALQDLEQSCKICPFEPEAWLLWAKILVESGQTRAASRVLTRYLVHYPEDTKIKGLLEQLARS